MGKTKDKSGTPLLSATVQSVQATSTGGSVELTLTLHLPEPSEGTQPMQLCMTPEIARDLYLRLDPAIRTAINQRRFG